MSTAAMQTTAGSSATRLLADETDFYETNKDELIRNHINRYLLIKGPELIGSFASEDQAIAEGFRRFGTEPFLVRLTGEDTPVLFVPALTLGIPLCRS